MHAAKGCMHAAPHIKRACAQVSTYVSYDSANQNASLSLREISDVFYILGITSHVSLND